MQAIAGCGSSGDEVVRGEGSTTFGDEVQRAVAGRSRQVGAHLMMTVKSVERALQGGPGCGGGPGSTRCPWMSAGSSTVFFKMDIGKSWPIRI